MFDLGGNGDLFVRDLVGLRHIASLQVSRPLPNALLGRFLNIKVRSGRLGDYLVLKEILNYRWLDLVQI